MTVAAGVESRLLAVRSRIVVAAERVGRDPSGVTLVGVTKGQPAAVLGEAIHAGLRDIGENRVQEAKAKRAALGETADGARWHLVGHLQTNKVRAALGCFAILQAVDSARLMRAIREAAEGPLDVMVEVNVSGEATKYGVRPDEIEGVLAEAGGDVRVRGLMTVAPLVRDAEAVRPVFRALRELQERHGMEWLSMGMSDDYEVAIEEGATHVRVGRALFGERGS
ncbi:MAG: YggS family pyridoxal phosphate-dependent enzyme [Tepidiformaceae bacterium]